MSQRELSQWIVVALLALGLVSCREKGNEFRAPEITKIEAVVEGSTATLLCTLSNARIDRCGFRLSDGEKESELEAVLSGNIFEATVQGLQVEKLYSFVAFASAGESEICSQPQTFSAPDGAIPIPDPAFKEYLLKEHDTDGDGEISLSEARVIGRIGFCTNELNVKSFSGIEYMPNLEEIHCPGEFIEGHDLGGREHYYLSKKYDRSWSIGPIGTLGSLDVSHNPELRVLCVYNNAALGDNQRVLDLSQNLKLEVVSIGFTALQMPDISHLPGLREIRFSNIWGPFPDLKPYTQLRALDLCHEKTGRRMDVDVSHCPYLEDLYVGGIAKTLSDLSFNPELKVLMDIDNDFTERDLSFFPKLREYYGYDNCFRTLDVSANPNLKILKVSPMDNNLLETLYIAPGQRIEGVTENRSEEYIPRNTKIVEKSLE